MTRRGIVAATLGLVLASCSRGSREENETYVDHLASLVLRYQERHGSPPQGFEEAHKESGVALPNRGDKYGRPLIYIKCGDRGFMFRANGDNRKDDLGLGDDVDLYYLDGKRVAREEFIAYLKGIDHGDFWLTYRELFE
jgi:hypothetical protein